MLAGLTLDSLIALIDCFILSRRTMSCSSMGCPPGHLISDLPHVVRCLHARTVQRGGVLFDAEEGGPFSAAPGSIRMPTPGSLKCRWGLTIPAGLHHTLGTNLMRDVPAVQVAGLFVGCLVLPSDDVVFTEPRKNELLADIRR